MRTNNHAKRGKIQDALDLLNDAAQEKKDEVYELIGDKYESLREVFETVLSNGQDVAMHAQKRINKSLHEEEKKIRQAAAQWGKKIHQEPWKYLGGVAVGSLIFGLLLGRKK